MDRTQLGRFSGHDKKPQWLAEADDWKITIHIVWGNWSGEIADSTVDRAG